MAARKDRTLRPQIQTLFNIGAIRDRTDGQLLERFATDRGELAELVFAALVERHGAMVMRACRSRLANDADAQDAFQATFLVLVKKARGLWVRDSLGPWLHQVALRTASCVRVHDARRRKHERRAAENTAAASPPTSELDVELRRTLHAEIDRLPERYRLPIVLCDLEGLTCEEAARRIGRPIGTVKSWRSRGRERLRRRLSRAGLAMTAALDVVLANDAAQGAVKPEAATVRAAAEIRSRPHADRTTPGEVSASVWMLVNGVMKAMLFSKLRTAAAVAATLACVSAGLGVAAQSVAGDVEETRCEQPNHASTPAAIPSPQPLPSPFLQPERAQWPLTLQDAVRIGLSNFEETHNLKPPEGFVADDDQIVLFTNGQDVHRLRSAVMARVRLIEQRYWTLLQQNDEVRPAEMAVRLTDELWKREKVRLEMGPGTTADVKEAVERLEQFKIDHTNKTSEAATAELELRHALGLPNVDDRRIIPTSEPRTDRATAPEWKTCLNTMLEKHPDVAAAKSKQSDSEAGRLAQLDEAKGIASTDSDLKPRTSPLDEAVHQSTHLLARRFLEEHAGYKQYQTAVQLRTASQQRWEAQKAFFEEGRITIDRYLDAIRHYSSDIAQEARFKFAYNIGITLLEEAQGTLLEARRIKIVESPDPGGGSSSPPHTAAAQPTLEPRTGVPDAAVESASGPAANPSQATARSPKVSLTNNGLSFEVTIPLPQQPVTIRGAFSISPAP